MAFKSKTITLGGREEILAFNSEKLKLKSGDFVRARLDFSKEKKRKLQAFVVEKMDYHPSSAKGDVTQVMSKLGIPFEFRREVLEEAESFPSQIEKEKFKDREDLTKLPFVTMDGALAEDFDDAIFVKKITGGFQTLCGHCGCEFLCEGGFSFRRGSLFKRK